MNKEFSPRSKGFSSRRKSKMVAPTMFP